MTGGASYLLLDARSGRTRRTRSNFSRHKASLLEKDLKSEITCSVDFSAQARAMYAVDASNYRQPPIGVVTPHTVEDVVRTVKICRRWRAPVLARGGGTSLAGQTCNTAIVIDFSRHLNRVIDIDAKARRARVEPGCILDTLRRQAEAVGLTFGPDPATHDHNSLGGMIGNNSCGAHSVMSGRTSDYVERLTVITSDGEVMDIGPTPEAELHRRLGEAGRQGQIYRRLLRLRDRYGDAIRARYPDIARRVSGFENLDALLPGRDFNVAQAITGTEGTCAIVLDATLRLIENPRCRALVILGFKDIDEAADAVPDILDCSPIAIEGFDDVLYERLQHGNVDASGLRHFPAGDGWLIVETGGQSPEEAASRAEQVVRSCLGAQETVLVTDPADQAQIWKARESALGATAFVAGGSSHWPGWEDSAVPPERLGDYLRAFRKLLDRHGYDAAFYGHFGDGLLHCRINFDLTSEAGIARYRGFAVSAAELVARFGGSLSGEHGDGQARAELLEAQYGAELLQCFREFKSIWDPDNLFNPGKAIMPFPLDSNIRLDRPNHSAVHKTHFAYPDDGGSFEEAANRCVGVGACRRLDVGEEVMCPSYVATREEKHSTRGRAHLLNEMIRGEVIAHGWRSDEVEDALSLCLACKGCKSDCPVGVDIATLKAEFRAHHYAQRLRPRSAYATGYLYRWAPLAASLPGLFNFLAHTTGFSHAAKWIAGLHSRAAVPRFADKNFRRWFRRRHSGRSGKQVVLWPDTFTNFFEPQVGVAATRLIEAAGFEVVLPGRHVCCGRTLYDHGFVTAAKRLWVKTFEILASEIESDTPVVILEPACASAFKDELPRLFPDDERASRLSQSAIYFADFLEDHIEDTQLSSQGAGRVYAKPHCHHHAVLDFSRELELLRRAGFEADRLSAGCCGMAGSFGLTRETHDVATAIARDGVWKKIEGIGNEQIVADGFSCREQIRAGTDRKPLHVAELLASGLAMEVRPNIPS